MDIFEIDVFRNAIAGAPILSHRSEKSLMVPNVGDGISIGAGPPLTVTHVQYQFLPDASGSLLQRCIIITN